MSFGSDRLTKQPGLAVGGGQQAGEHLHGGGLAAPIAAQKAKNLAALDAKAHMVHRHKVAKLHGQALGLDGDLCRRIGLQGGDDHRLVPAPLGLGQQGHKGGFQAGVASALHQLGRRARGKDAAFVHGHQPVKALGFFHVGGGHQHAHAGAAGADAGNQIPELGAGQRAHAGGGLVQDEQPGCG